MRSTKSAPDRESCEKYLRVAMSRAWRREDRVSRLLRRSLPRPRWARLALSRHRVARTMVRLGADAGEALTLWQAWLADAAGAPASGMASARAAAAAARA